VVRAPCGPRSAHRGLSGPGLAPRAHHTTPARSRAAAGTRAAPGLATEGRDRPRLGQDVGPAQWGHGPGSAGLWEARGQPCCVAAGAEGDALGGCHGLLGCGQGGEAPGEGAGQGQPLLVLPSGPWQRRGCEGACWEPCTGRKARWNTQVSFSISAPFIRCNPLVSFTL